MAEPRVRSFIMLPHEARAATDGRLTQIRRIARNIEAAPHFRSGWKAVVNNRRNAVSAISIDAPARALGPACPFGQPGDLLVGKETFACVPGNEFASVHFMADRPIPGVSERHDAGLLRLRSPVTMPRWASRFTLQIEDVRVQRVQDASEDDAIAWGIEEVPCAGPGWHQYRNYGSSSPATQFGFPLNSYRSLWGSIHSPDSWDANPWTWVATVRVHQKNIYEYLRKAA